MPIARSPPRPAELTAGGVGAGRNLARRDSARPDDRMPTSGGLGTPTSDDAAGLAAEGRFLIPCWRGSRCRSGSGFWERPIVAPLLIGLALGPSNADSVGDLARVLSTASTRRYRTATFRRSGFAVAGDRASGLAPRSGRLAALLAGAPRHLGASPFRGLQPRPAVVGEVLRQFPRLLQQHAHVVAVSCPFTKSNFSSTAF